MHLFEALCKINIKLWIDLLKDNGQTNKIRRLSQLTKKWAIVGEMQNARKDHNVVFYENHFLVTGGIGSGVYLPTERCILANDEVTCKSQTPWYDSLYDYWWMETFIVPIDFCQ